MIYRQVLRNPKPGREINHVIILVYYNPGEKSALYVTIYYQTYAVNWETGSVLGNLDPSWKTFGTVCHFPKTSAHR